MSSFIGIGFIYDQSTNLENEINKFISFFLFRNIKIRKIIYCTDKNGDNWKDETIDNCSSENITPIFINNYFVKVTMEGNFLNKEKICVNMSVSRISKRDFGFLLEININQLFIVGNREDLNNCTENIISLCKDIYQETQYRYAYCDHEVDIEYNWNEFTSLKNEIYSVCIIPQKNNFLVSLASWEIDGLTNR